MNNLEKKLDALIDALGFDVETTFNISYGTTIKAGSVNPYDIAKKEFKFFPATAGMKEAEYKEVIRTTDYKLTKKKYNEQPSLHKIIRLYEVGKISTSELASKIKGLLDENI